MAHLTCPPAFCCPRAHLSADLCIWCPFSPQVWVEQLAGRLLAMDQQTFRQEHQAYQKEKLNLTTALANLAESVAAMRTLVSESQADAAADPDNKQLVAAAGKQLENMQVS